MQELRRHFNSPPPPNPPLASRLLESEGFVRNAERLTAGPWIAYDYCPQSPNGSSCG